MIILAILLVYVMGNAQQGHKQKIGIFDSRAIAIVYARSEYFKDPNEIDAR